MKAIFILITALMIGTITANVHTIENSANCAAELSVENNLYSKPTNENGTKFTLTLKNTSPKTTTYLLSAKSLEEVCGNNAMNSLGNYVELITSYYIDKTSFSNNEIVLNSGQSYTFKVRVNVPLDASNNDWGCTEIEVKPNGCSSSNIKTVLSIYVPNN